MCGSVRNAAEVWSASGAWRSGTQGKGKENRSADALPVNALTTKAKQQSKRRINMTGGPRRRCAVRW